MFLANVEHQPCWETGTTTLNSITTGVVQPCHKDTHPCQGPSYRLSRALVILGSPNIRHGDPMASRPWDDGVSMWELSYHLPGRW